MLEKGRGERRGQGEKRENVLWLPNLITIDAFTVYAPSGAKEGMTRAAFRKKCDSSNKSDNTKFVVSSMSSLSSFVDVIDLLVLCLSFRFPVVLTEMSFIGEKGGQQGPLWTLFQQ